MSTNLTGIKSFVRILHHFVLAKLATGSIRVKYPGNLLGVDSGLTKRDIV